MYENTKLARVVSPDGETDLFDILAGVLQGNSLAPYLFVISLTMHSEKAIEGKEKKCGFHLEKRKSKRVGPKVEIDLDFADDRLRKLSRLKNYC